MNPTTEHGYLPEGGLFAAIFLVITVSAPTLNGITKGIREFMILCEDIQTEDKDIQTIC